MTVKVNIYFDFVKKYWDINLSFQADISNGCFRSENTFSCCCLKVCGLCGPHKQSANSRKHPRGLKWKCKQLVGISFGPAAYFTCDASQSKKEFPRVIFKTVVWDVLYIKKNEIFFSCLLSAKKKNKHFFLLSSAAVTQQIWGLWVCLQKAERRTQLQSHAGICVH